MLSILNVLDCVILSKWLHLSGPHFSQLSNERAEMFRQALPASTFYNSRISRQFPQRHWEWLLVSSLPLTESFTVVFQYLMAIFPVRYAKLPKSATRRKAMKKSVWSLYLYLHEKSGSSRVSYSEKADLPRHVHQSASCETEEASCLHCCGVESESMSSAPPMPTTVGPKILQLPLLFQWLTPLQYPCHETSHSKTKYFGLFFLTQQANNKITPNWIIYILS